MNCSHPSPHHPVVFIVRDSADQNHAATYTLEEARALLELVKKAYADKMNEPIAGLLNMGRELPKPFIIKRTTDVVEAIERDGNLVIRKTTTTTVIDELVS